MLVRGYIRPSAAHTLVDAATTEATDGAGDMDRPSHRRLTEYLQCRTVQRQPRWRLLRTPLVHRRTLDHVLVQGSLGHQRKFELDLDTRHQIAHIPERAVVFP